MPSERTLQERAKCLGRSRWARAIIVSLLFRILGVICRVLTCFVHSETFRSVLRDESGLALEQISTRPPSLLARMGGPQTHDHVVPNAEGGTEGCSSSATSTSVAPTPQPLGGTMVADNEDAGETSPRHLLDDHDESLTASGRTSTLRRSARRRLSESESENEGNMQDVGGSGMEDGDMHGGAASNSPATTNTLLRGWECPACTLVNAPGENLCAACSRRCR